MEYSSPASLPLWARWRVFLADLAFVWACIRRFVSDHITQPCHPQPQAHSRTARRTPFYKLNEQQQAEELQARKQRSERPPPPTDASPGASAESTVGVARLPPAPAPLPQLRVLSLNFWGLPISPRVNLRAHELGKVLHLYDLVAFQELSHEREVAWLQQHCTSIGLVHHYIFNQGVGFPIWHGVTAPSLALFSRFPIIDVAFKRFSINGKMSHISHSDYMGSKGVGLVRVDVSELVYPNVAPGVCRPLVGVDVFLTHLHANYTNFFYDWRKWMPLLQEYEQRERAAPLSSHEAMTAAADLSPAELPEPLMSDIRDEYLAHRVLQSFELARFIAAQRRPDFLTLLAGDLNCPPYDLCIQIIQSIALGQSVGCVPRLIDSFAELHPHSRGFTCGAADNSFTFSTDFLQMECRKPNAARGAKSTTHGHSNGTSTSTGTSTANGEASTHGTSLPNSAPGSATEDGGVRRRARFNSSPASTLMPSDSSLRASRSFGEHPHLLSSIQLSGVAEGDERGADASSEATGVADASSSVERSPLAFIDDDAPKRIDYVMYANASKAMSCRCRWDLMQHANEQLDDSEPEVQAAAAACQCAAALAELPPPSQLWRITSSTIFKQYVQAADGRMMSISDHHGVSVVVQLQRAGDSPQPPPSPTQSASTIIVSRHTPTTSAASDKVSPAQECAVPPVALRKLKIVQDGKEVGEEEELFTLDQGGVLNSPTLTGTFTGASLHGKSTLVGGDVPALSTSSLLLLASGVCWLGLRDATDRRTQHLTRMALFFAVYLIGCQSLWMFLLNACFGNLMETYVLPREIPLHSSVLSFLALVLRIMDVAHSLLPIYLVCEYLLTTFPAKEEQSAMRQTLSEVNMMRRFNIVREKRRALFAQKSKQDS